MNRKQATEAELSAEFERSARRDYGGKGPMKVLMARAKRMFPDINEEVARKCAEFAHEESIRQIAGCKKRMRHPFDESIRRNADYRSIVMSIQTSISKGQPKGTPRVQPIYSDLYDPE